VTLLAEMDGPDVLTDVLSSLRLRGRLFCRTELTAPWTLTIPPDELAQFHVVEDGRCWIHLDGEERARELAPGDLVVLPHGHGYRLTDSSQGSEAWMIRGSFCFEGRGGHPLLSLLPPVVHLHAEEGREGGWLEMTLKLLSHEARHPRPGTETLITRLIDILFVQVVRAWIESLPEGSGGWLGALRDRQIGTALGCIHREPQRAWSVAALASTVLMSRSAFAARFTALVGEPPLSYLTRWRMHLAADLLRGKGLSLSEVARRIGYESEAAFSRAFKRRLGASPGAFRRPAVASF
jgi:AraC-like DNA-binding protein